MKKQTKSLLLLMVNMFVVMMGIGLVIPILPYYVDSFGAGSIELGVLIALFAFMQFLTAPFWGKLSDQVGRKPLIAIGMFGFAVAEFIFAFATQMWMLYMSRIIAGAFGAAVMPTAMAYVADTTTEEKRSKGMGLLGMSMALGIVFGPGIGGWLAEVSLSTPFLFAGIAASLACVFSLLFLPESLPEDKRTVKGELKTSQFSDMWQALRSPVGFLLGLVFVLSFGLANFQTVFGMYAWDRFLYSPSEVGTIVMIVGVVGAVAQGGLIGRLSKRFGDEKVALGSLLLSGVGFILMSFAFNYSTLIVTTCLFFLGNSLLRPSVNAMISKLAGKKQGLVMGVNNSFVSLGNVMGALLAGNLFAFNIFFPFAVGASMMFLAFFSTILWLGKQKNKAIKHTEEVM
ncbi:tetracycline resistance MFS efflux pump [Alteribacter aurantiacus]|uniref:tetracycline resistance MFS efflux pump n=1 Tax=Alteribacter aurantiacus TaxID=254410 RepID=UPI00041ED09C|nr:tetracycline resistance MFS efflux pump [Alteribacter aurantiacus]